MHKLINRETEVQVERKRAHLAGFRNGGGEIRVAEQCRRRRGLPPRFRQDRLPYLPHPLASEFQLAADHIAL
jgi:hypothetical protein